MKSCRALGAALTLAAASLACGDTPASPTSSTTSPFAANFNGFYSESMRLTGVSGGECVGADLTARLSSVDVGTLTITQKQSDVTVVVRSATTGLQCTYEGNASLATFAVSVRSCDAAQINFGCSNGQSRTLELVGSTITATISGNTTTGTVATTYNVFARGTNAQTTPVAGLVTQQQFTAARR